MATLDSIKLNTLLEEVAFLRNQIVELDHRVTEAETRPAEILQAIQEIWLRDPEVNEL
jgi:hypothetical protein